MIDVSFSFTTLSIDVSVRLYLRNLGDKISTNNTNVPCKTYALHIELYNTSTKVLPFSWKLSYRNYFSSYNSFSFTINQMPSDTVSYLLLHYYIILFYLHLIYYFLHLSILLISYQLHTHIHIFIHKIYLLLSLLGVFIA